MSTGSTSSCASTDKIREHITARGAVQSRAQRGRGGAGSHGAPHLQPFQGSQAVEVSGGRVGEEGHSLANELGDLREAVEVVEDLRQGGKG